MDCCVGLVNGSETVAKLFVILESLRICCEEIALILLEIALGNSGIVLS